jgi:hypothetical protein
MKFLSLCSFSCLVCQLVASCGSSDAVDQQDAGTLDMPSQGGQGGRSTGGAGGVATAVDAGSTEKQDTLGMRDTGAGKDAAADSKPTGDTAASAGCGAAAGYMFCDDFENQAAGDPPDDKRWRLSSVKALAAIDNTRMFHGKQSLKLSVAPDGAASSRILPIGIFPLAQDHFFMRLHVYFDALPAGTPHWTFQAVRGKLSNSTAYTELRSISLLGKKLFLNHNGSPLGELGLYDSKPPAGQAELRTNEWMCFEIEVNGEQSEARLWWNDQEHTSLHLTKANTAGPNKTPWPIPMIEEMFIGPGFYGPALVAMNVWLDDVAISKTRIGCGN